MEWSANLLQELPLIRWILTPHHVHWDSTQIKLNHLTFPKFDLFYPLTFIALLDPSFLFGRSLPFTLFCKNTVYPLSPNSNALSCMKHTKSLPEACGFHVYICHAYIHTYVSSIFYLSYQIIVSFLIFLLIILIIDANFLPTM